MGSSFELLPVDERIAQYREMADATLVKAQEVEDPHIRARYLNMATGWYALVRDLEAGFPDPEMVTMQADADEQPDSNPE